MKENPKHVEDCYQYLTIGFPEWENTRINQENMGTEQNIPKLRELSDRQTEKLQ